MEGRLLNGEGLLKLPKETGTTSGQELVMGIVKGHKNNIKRTGGNQSFFLMGGNHQSYILIRV